MRKWEQFTPMPRTGSSNRSFAITFAIFFLLVALFSHHHLVFLTLGILMLLTGLFIPRLLHYPNRAWFLLGLFLHRITNPIIAGIIFFLILTPYAFVLRLFKKNLLNLKSSPASTWHKSIDPPPHNMEHPF